MLNNKKGFTLVELMISIVILTFIIGTAYSLINSSSRLVLRQVNTTNAQNDIRTTVDWITRDLKESVSFNRLNEGNILYIVEKGNSTVKYIKAETGKISNNKIYKIIRKSDNEEFVMLENIPEEGFNIENKNSLYHVTIKIKDKLNNDKIIEFDVSSKINSAIADRPGDDEGDGDPSKPYIDIDNNGKFDGSDYNIEFINGVYDWKKDEKYVKGILVFPSDFIVKSNSITCIARDGIRVDKDVTLEASKDGNIKLITKNIIMNNTIISTDTQGNKSGGIDIQANGTVSFNYAQLKVKGKGSNRAEGNINISAKGSIEGNYSNIICNSAGSGSREINILSNGSIILAYCKLQSNSNGNASSTIDITASGNVNCSFSNLSANRNGNSNSNIKISSVGGTDKSFVNEEGNGTIIIK